MTFTKFDGSSKISISLAPNFSNEDIRNYRKFCQWRHLKLNKICQRYIKFHNIFLMKITNFSLNFGTIFLAKLNYRFTLIKFSNFSHLCSCTLQIRCFATKIWNLNFWHIFHGIKVQKQATFEMESFNSTKNCNQFQMYYTYIFKYNHTLLNLFCLGYHNNHSLLSYYRFNTF